MQHVALAKEVLDKFFCITWDIKLTAVFWVGLCPLFLNGIVFHVHTYDIVNS